MSETSIVTWNQGSPELPVGDAARYLVAWKTESGKNGTCMAWFLNRHFVPMGDTFEPKPTDEIKDDEVALNGWFSDEQDYYGDAIWVGLEFTPIAWAKVPHYTGAINQSEVQ